MIDILKYFKRGLRGTILLANDGHFSYGSKWQAVQSSLSLDRWYMGDFSSAEYTINIELGKDKKEIKDAAEVTMKNGRKAMKGKCPTCGTGMFRILGKS